MLRPRERVPNTVHVPTNTGHKFDASDVQLLCFWGNAAQALAGCFARQDCPIWADSSTTRECHELEEALGGAKAVAEATGSAAYCRFSGNQVNYHKVCDGFVFLPSGHPLSLSADAPVFIHRAVPHFLRS